MTEMIKGFEDLDVFKRAYHLSLEVHRVSSTFPKEERYDLTSQLRRDESMDSILFGFRIYQRRAVESVALRIHRDIEDVIGIAQDLALS